MSPIYPVTRIPRITIAHNAFVSSPPPQSDVGTRKTHVCARGRIRQGGGGGGRVAQSVVHVMVVEVGGRTPAAICRSARVPLSAVTTPVVLHSSKHRQWCLVVYMT
jgi:hypothetical protein